MAVAARSRGRLRARSTAILLLVIASASVACATRSMWTRQTRVAAVQIAVKDHAAAREELELALALAESPPADGRLIAVSLAMLAEVDIAEERFDAAALALRRAAALHAERGVKGGEARDRDLERLRFALVQAGRLEDAQETHAALLASIEQPRVTGLVWNGAYYERKLEKRSERRAPLEASFGQLLAEAGYYEEALDAFGRADLYRANLHLVNEANSQWVLARADALDGLGRSDEAAALRAEAEAVRARSDYVSSVLLGSEFQEIVVRWTDEAMPLRVHVKRPSASVVRDPEAAVRMVREAARSWEDVARPGVPRFEFVRRASEADIRVQWAHDQSFDGPVGVCQPRTSWDDEPLKGAKVTLITRIMGTYLSDERVRHVAIHELGHALGLMGHSARVDDVMYESIDAEPLAAPSERDRRTVQRLYDATPGQSYNP